MKKVTQITFVANDGTKHETVKDAIAHDLLAMASVPAKEEGKRATNALGKVGVAFLIENRDKIRELLTELDAQPELSDMDEAKPVPASKKVG